MEDYLRRVRSTLGAGGCSTSIHAVLGGPESDVDSVASTLCLALHLSQKEPSSGMCVPVLCVHRRDAVLPEDTVRYLQRVRVHESSLLWQSDVDLVKLHHTGRLSLTLLRDDVLDSSEYRTLESSVLRVVCRHGQRDAREEEEWGASSTAAVAKEILQEAAEHIGPALGETLGEALRLQSEILWIKHGRRSAPLEELMCSLEERCHVTVGQRQDSTQRPGIDMEQLLTKDLKEFSDGEITIAFATVTVDLEDWNGHASKLKVFCHRHSYESLVVVYAVHGAVHLSCQQVAVYADNTDILNQICCELEESSRWFLSGGLQAAECFQGCLQVYQIPTNTSSSSGSPHLLEEEIRDFLKELVDRRSASLACHPIRRTSSTEGVAGSVEFSQGSSGINDMYGSDTERPEGDAIGAVAIARVTADGEEDSGGVVVGAGGELVSPDSGMVMRSSRSSKESSVFLSDDSPIGEILAGGGAAAGAVGLFLRNPSPLGFSSLSPPERRTRRSSRNKSDNVDLFSFDPFHNISHPLPIGGASAQAGGRGVGGGRGAQGSSSLSEYEELSLVDLSIPDSLVGVKGRPPSDRHPPHSDNIRANAAIDIVVPPTPVNSLVGSCPPNSSDAMFFPEDVAERIQRLQHKESVSSSLSEAWDEFGHDLRGDSTSDETETGGSESLGNDVEAVKRRGTGGEVNDGEKMVGMIKLKADHQRDVSLKPQLSLITEHIESYDTWNPDSGFTETWNPATMDDLQLTPPEMETDWKCRPCVLGTSETNSLVRDRELLGTLTPETSKEDEDGMQGRKGDRQTELLDFWTYYAQKGFIKSDSGTTTSYPESLDMWNMTIRDDSLSPVTTPETDNLSEHSDSLCGRTSRFGGGASLESPLESVNGGMQMWNTTIQEDSASTLTSPEGAEMGKAHGHMGSWDASTEALEPHASEQAEKEKKVQEADKSLGWKGEEGKESVKIIIQGEEVIWTEEPQQSIQHVTLENQHDQPSSQHNLDTLAMPIPNMVTSTSEYDNVGAGAWSLPSSPDTHASPVGDTIQIEEQSSPFIAVVKPVETERGSDQYQKADRCSDYRAIIADNEEKDRQVFLFEGTGRLRHVTSEGRSIHDNKEGQEIVEHDSAPDWGDQPGSHSPFILVHGQHTSASHHLSPREASLSQTVPESLHLVNWDGLPDDGKKYDGSLDWTGKMTCPEDGPPTESNEDPHTEASENVEAAIADAMSLSSSSGGDRDGLKPSPDSLLPGSRDDLRSNSDGDSSSGLEMEYIIVSGTVKESERERKSVCRPHDGDSGRREGGKGRSMETFSMLSCAATLLQMQALHRQCQESKELNGHKQRITDPLSSAARENQLSSYSTALQSSSQSNIDMRHSNESTYDKYTTNQTYLGKATSSVPSPDHLTTALSCSSQPITARNHGQTSADNTSQDHTMTEIVNPTQSKCNVAGFHQSDTRSTGHSQGQEGNHDDQSNVVFRSVSSSLRYPSDNFLKAREEVYVHSQISMEDSDEDGHSPSTPPPRPPSLGGLQGWDGQLRGHGIPQISSELQSPVLTNSSFSYNTSLTGTPLSESAITTERDIGLPFAGDLMEEQQQDEEDEQEEAGLGASSHTGATGMLPHSELTGVCSSEFEGQTFEPKREKLHQNTTDYSTEQPMAALDSDEWSAEQQMRGNVSQEAACYGWSPTTANGDSSLSSLTRLQEVTSTKSSTDDQTPYGYNYHYPDQRTETQSDRPVYFETKGDSQQDNTDVYAEFGTEPTAARYGEYYETGVNAIAEYSSRDPGQHNADVPYHREDLAGYGSRDNVQHVTKDQRKDDPSIKHAAGYYCSQHKAQGHDQDETRHTHHQYDGESLYQPDLHRENEDHAQYVPDGYAHFHSRSFQQGDGAAGMVTKAASNDEDEMDNRADPPSTLDLSGGSNQRKKLSAPPMNVSLDRSEGSVLSDDALDTGDEALDTGDDLDLNIDDLDTPDEAESLDFNGQGELEPCAGATGRSDAVLEYDASEERSDSRLWRSIVIGEQEHRIDMKCIEPYQRVISHGGYYDDKNAIIVFAACFLPDSDCDNYHYVMENLFLYVISTLELMVAEDYMVVYLNGATPRRRMPGFGWMKKCYQMIDRRLKKNLKSFIIVHPSWFIRTVLGITRPFISSKFSSKIKYVNSLAELQGMIPMEYIHIPPSIVNNVALCRRSLKSACNELIRGEAQLFDN